MTTTRHSLYSIQLLGIPTVEYLELDDVDQFEEKKAYVIGILEGRDLRYERECTNFEECERFSNELRRIHGRDARIFFYEKIPSSMFCEFRITGKDSFDLTSRGEIDEESKNELMDWFELLRKNYDFTNPIVGTISKDQAGRLFISSIQ